MELEIQTTSQVLAGLLRDDKNKPEGVSINITPPSYESRGNSIPELAATVLVGFSVTVSASLVSRWLMEKIKKHDPDPKITYNRKEIEVSEEGIKRIIETNIEINKRS